MLIATLAAILVLIILSGYFSGSETALTAASRPRLHHLEQEGDKRARLVNRLIEKRERLIGAILLGNNAVNILASALATSFLISVFGEAGVAYATVAITLLVLVFAEVMPKTYALRNADRVALAVAPTMRVIVFLLAPITKAVQGVVRVTMRLFGVDIAAGENLMISSQEELRGALDLHARKGTMVKHDRDMLGSILDLSDVDVGEIMVHRSNIVVIDANDPPSQITDQVLQSPYTRFPVWRGDPDNIVGILHAKDLLRAILSHGGDSSKVDIGRLLTKPWFVPETRTLRSQLEAFRRRCFHVALVVDEYGSIMGMVTLEDILEEIVGDIDDEHDVAVAGVKVAPDGSFTVRGTATIRDLNRKFEWGLPDEEAATIAGLVIHESQQIPEVGHTFVFYGFTFEVLSRRRNQIVSMRVVPPKNAHPGEQTEDNEQNNGDSL